MTRRILRAFALALAFAAAALALILFWGVLALWADDAAAWLLG